MKLIKSALVLALGFSSFSAFANHDMDSNCKIIAKACLTAGFKKEEGNNKKFWEDCMKPILMGKTVAGVTVDPVVVNACRAKKIEKMKLELEDLQNASK